MRGSDVRTEGLFSYVSCEQRPSVWDVTVFTKNHDRLLAGDIAAKFFEAVLSQPQITALLADEHFTVDGTLIEAEASMKSFKPKAEGGDQPPASGAGEDGRNRDRDFHGERRSKRDPRLDHRPQGPAAAQGPGQGGQALLQWATC